MKTHFETTVRALKGPTPQNVVRLTVQEDDGPSIETLLSEREARELAAMLTKSADEARDLPVRKVE